MIELSIQVRNSESSLTEKHLSYDGIYLSTEDPALMNLVNEARQKFCLASQLSQDDEIDIIVRAKMTV